MLTAHELKKGMFIEHEKGIHKILDSQYHKGSGKTANFVHLKIRDVNTGRIHELHVDPQAKVAELPVTRRNMRHLYEDADGLCFMDPQTFEQVTVNAAAIGNGKAYLREEMEVEVAMYNGSAIHVSMPERVTLEVSSTAEGIRGDTDSVYKPATMTNGMEILVPQFIKNGDRIVVDTETGKYIERSK